MQRDWTVVASLIADARKALDRAAEGIEAFEAMPDGYCACKPGRPCYLHGVLIPEAVVTVERALQELRRREFPARLRQ